MIGRGPLGPQEQLSAGATAELLSVPCSRSTGPKGLPGVRCLSPH